MLVRRVGRLIARYKVKSLLDIGAGFASTAVPLSKMVTRYVAVENNRERSSALQKAGLEVTTCSFPLSLVEQFDMVLCSHSVPEINLSLYPAFLESAWQAVNRR